MIWNGIFQEVPNHYAASKLELDVPNAVKCIPFIKYMSVPKRVVYTVQSIIHVVEKPQK